MPIPAGASKQQIGQTIGHEFKHGTLHSGRGGPVVKKRKQELAIMMSVMRKRGMMHDKDKKDHDAD